MTSREEFLRKLRVTFKIEASEGVAKITSYLIELEKSTGDHLRSEHIEALFREAHSLKGAARAVNVSEIETICQHLESVFSGLKSKQLNLSGSMFDVFHSAVNLISQYLNEPDEEVSENLSGSLGDLLSQLSRLETENEVNKIDTSRTGPPVADSESVTVTKSSAEKEPGEEVKQNTEAKATVIPMPGSLDSTIRISVEKMDNLFHQVEEMLTLKQTFNHINESLDSTIKRFDSWSHEASGMLSVVKGMRQQTEQAEQTVMVDRIVLNRLFNYLEAVASLQKSMGIDLSAIRKQTLAESYNSQVKIGSLLDQVKEIISVPFSTILDVFPKAARDISRNIGKNAVVEISGGEMEIDRRILEELRIPMMHLLRNSIDHGIEKPEIRKQKRKSETGTIKITVDRFENNHAEVKIVDDGAGINFSKVRQKYAINHHLSSAEAEDIEEQKLIDYLFTSGVSTSDMITDLSGRGLGLTIAKEKIDQMGGALTVKSLKDQGTEFLIEVPLSLVTLRGVLIKVGDHEFVVPTARIERVIKVGKPEIKSIGKKNSIDYLNGIIPLVYLSDILEIPSREGLKSDFIVLVVGNAENHVGFALDEILGEDLIMSKKFNDQLKRVRNISGATVLGSGKVVPILNVQDLIRSALKESGQRIGEVVAASSRNQGSILIVEDSITSRMLLKNILEAAGYKVFTAVDGIDGYTSLKANPTDLVISDVDMPRMSGLDMTAKIRSDSAVSKIPVILVTSLSKREDRERGLEVGANAYIVKSAFDQSNLLDVVEKLIG